MVKRAPRTPEYRSWCCMLTRCENPRSDKYPLYGGRGIKVCERWHTFENFLSDMGSRPAGKTLDRINSNGDYEPSNCRWSSLREQNNNKRTNVLISIGSRTQTATQWAKENGLSRKRVHARLKRGWTPEDAVMRPIRKWRKP